MNQNVKQKFLKKVFIKNLIDKNNFSSIFHSLYGHYEIKKYCS